MHSNNKIDRMVSDISENIERLEQQLKEEYKRLITLSSDFDDIAADLVLLERGSLPPAIKEYETTTIVDKLLARVGATFGTKRDQFFILQAALDVMHENTSAAVNSRN